MERKQWTEAQKNDQVRRMGNLVRGGMTPYAAFVATLEDPQAGQDETGR